MNTFLAVMRIVALVATALIGGSIVFLSIYSYFAVIQLPAADSMATEDAFNLVIPQGLLPVFNALVASVLAYIFGKPLTEAISARIRGKG
jgi:hypothetical protein